METTKSRMLRAVGQPPLLILLLVLLGLAAYLNALDNPFLFDDIGLLKGNTQLNWSRFSSLWSTDYPHFFPGWPSSWRPMSVLTYLANRSLFGDDPTGWRAVYLAVHLLSGVMVFLLGSACWGRPLVSFTVAAVFLVHPINSEALNEVSYNEDVLMTAFLLASSLLLASWSRRRSLPAAAGALLCYILALLSKETALFFPLLLLVWYALRRRLGAGKRLADLLLAGSFFLAALLFSTVHFGMIVNPWIRRTSHYSPAALLEGIPVLLSLFSVYLRRFLLPFDLAALHDAGPMGWSSPSVWAGLAIVLALAWCVARGLARGRPELALPPFWIAAGMAPVIYNLTHPGIVYSFDHYLYAPGIGMLWLAAAFHEGVLRAKAPPRLLALVWRVLLPSLVAALMLVTWQRNAIWSDGLSLWRDATAKSPASSPAHAGLGSALREAGRAGEALEEYRLAAALDPRYPDVHHNLGTTLEALGRDQEAVGEYRLAASMDPGYSAAPLALGRLYAKQGRAGESLAAYRAATQADPYLASAWFEMGNGHYDMGEMDEAARCFGRTLELLPENANALLNLGNVSLARGDLAGAEALYRRAVAVDPGLALAWNNLGEILMKRGATSEALPLLRKALDLDPSLTSVPAVTGKAGRPAGK